MIQFDPNSVNLSQEGESRLKELLPELIGKPHRIEVRGHAVSDNSRGDNALLDALMISYRRSLVVFEFLSKQGVEPERMRLSQAGGSEPRFVGQSVDPNANARVEIYLLEETYEAPAEMMKRMVSSQSAKPPTEAELAKAMEGANVPAATGGHGEESPKDKHKGGH